jgi:hypothetical protein
MSAIPAAFGGKATDGGLPLQISPWHGAFPAGRLPRQSAREAPGKRLARGPAGKTRQRGRQRLGGVAPSSAALRRGGRLSA